MLKKITLAALLAVGGATLSGVAAQPAAADSYHGRVVFHRGAVHGGVNYRPADWRVVRFGRRGAGRRFLRLVREGSIVCFTARPRHAGYRGYRREHRFYHPHGRRLGFRAVRNLARHGRFGAMRCFRRA